MLKDHWEETGVDCSAFAAVVTWLYDPKVRTQNKHSQLIIKESICRCTFFVQPFIVRVNSKNLCIPDIFFNQNVSLFPWYWLVKPFEIPTSIRLIHSKLHKTDFDAYMTTRIFGKEEIIETRIKSWYKIKGYRCLFLVIHTHVVKSFRTYVLNYCFLTLTKQHTMYMK